MFGYVKRAGSTTEDRLTSLIGSNLTIDGEIVFTGAMRVDGTVRGAMTVPVRSEGTLIVGEQGRIEGDVRVSNLVVGGQVQGSVFATGSVTVASTGRVAGELHYGRLELETGGQVDGSLAPVRMPDPAGSGQTHAESERPR